MLMTKKNPEAKKEAARVNYKKTPEAKKEGARVNYKKTLEAKKEGARVNYKKKTLRLRKRLLRSAMPKILK